VILVDVHDNAARRLRGAMQPLDRGSADVNPRLQRACQIADGNRRIVGVGQAARERDAVGELEAIRQHPRDEKRVGFRGMAGDPQVEMFVDAAIGVGEIDLEGEDGGGQRHQR
jgi:hypothetical protein